MRKAIIIMLSAVMASGVYADNSLGRKDYTKAKADISVAKWAPIESTEAIQIHRLSAPKATIFDVTSGDMDPKRLTYVAPDNYYSLVAQNLFSNYGIIGVYAHYTPELISRFKGNKLTKINTVAYDGAQEVIVRVLDSNKDIIFEQEAELGDTSLGWGYSISIDTDIDLTGEDIYVGYDMEFAEGERSGLVLMQSGRTQNGSFMVDYYDGKDLYSMSDDFAGVPIIWCETEGDAGLYRNDVTVESVGGGRVNVGDHYNITGTFINMGSEPIRYVTVSYQRADGTDSESVLDAGEYLPYMNKIQFNMQAVADNGAGIFERDVTVTKINGESDDNPADNTGSSVLFAIDRPMERNIAIEDYTGSWCGFCTRGICAMRMIDEMYGSRVVRMELHTQDIMSYRHGEAYEKYCAMIPGWPECWINRTHMGDPWFGSDEYASHYFGMGDQVADLMKKPVEVGLDLLIEMSDDQSTIHAKTDATFSLEVDELSKYYSIGYMLLENGITDTQTNYYSAEYAQHPCSKEELPEEMRMFFDLPYEYEETYDHVVREEIGSLGIPNSLSGHIDVGDTMSHEIDIPTNAILNDKNNAVVAAFVIDNATGEILNIIAKDILASGMESIATDMSKGKEYYNIQGIKLNPTHLPTNEVIIVKENGKVHKTIIR